SRGRRSRRACSSGRSVASDFSGRRDPRGRLRPLFAPKQRRGSSDSAQKTRKTAWLSGSGAAVRVFARGSICRQEEWDLTKQEFVNEIARRADLSSRDAAKAVDAFLDAVTDSRQGGGEVAFTGF